MGSIKDIACPACAASPARSRWALLHLAWHPWLLSDSKAYFTCLHTNRHAAQGMSHMSQVLHACCTPASFPSIQSLTGPHERAVPCTRRQVRPGLQRGLQPDRPAQLRVGGPCSAVRSPCPPPARHQPSPARPEDQLHASRLVVPVPRRLPALPAVWVQLPKPLPRHPDPSAPEVGPLSWGSQACKRWAEQGASASSCMGCRDERPGHQGPRRDPRELDLKTCRASFPTPSGWPWGGTPQSSLQRVFRGGCMGCSIKLVPVVRLRAL